MSKLSLSSITIVAARVLLLGLAGGAVVTAFSIAKRERARAVDPGGAYICPMHPEVSSAAPGDCPVCGMALEVRKIEAAPVAASPGADANAVTFQLPQTAAIDTFDDVGYGKMFETSREMRAPAWAENHELGQAVLYRDEIAMLEPAEGATFSPATRRKNGSPSWIEVRRVDEPPIAWDRATALVRFRVNANARLVPGQVGSLKFATRTRNMLAVRASAIVQSPTGPYVFLLAKDNRTLTKRPVEIGAVRAGHAAVLSGLAIGERIAAQNTFFLDAERRFAETAP